jgi:hypothetical protein
MWGTNVSSNDQHSVEELHTSMWDTIHTKIYVRVNNNNNNNNNNVTI